MQTIEPDKKKSKRRKGWHKRKKVIQYVDICDFEIYYEGQDGHPSERDF